MNTDQLCETYFKWRSLLEKLGSFPLSENPTVSRMEISSAVIQEGYKKIHRDYPEMSLIEFACFLSMVRIQRDWIMSSGLLVGRRLDPLPGIASSRMKLRFYLAGLAEIIWRFEADGRNTLRIFGRNPALFFGTDDWRSFCKTFANYEESYLKQLCLSLISGMSLIQLEGGHEEDIRILAQEVAGGIRNPKSPNISIQPSGKGVIEVTLSEKKVLAMFVEYLSHSGESQIRRAKCALAKFFAFRPEKMNEATIFYGIKGLVEVGLLRRVETVTEGKKTLAHAHELNREVFESHELVVRKGLRREFMHSSYKKPKQ